MSFSRGPGFQAPARVPPFRAPKGPVLAVGSRALVSCPGAGARQAILTNDDLVTARATIPDGAEVEILAWHPNGANGTRYRVLSLRDGVEGWIGATSLKPRARPPVPEAARLPAPPVSIPPARTLSRGPVRPAAGARVEPVATKAAERAGKKTGRKRG